MSDTYQPIVIYGTWHEPDDPLKQAAFRMVYRLVVNENQPPSLVFEEVVRVFEPQGIPEPELRKIVHSAVGFLLLPCEGSA